MALECLLTLGKVSDEDEEGKQAAHWTRLSCRRFRANEVRLQLSVLAYNLGNLCRRLVLPKRVDSWSFVAPWDDPPSDCRHHQNGFEVLKDELGL